MKLEFSIQFFEKYSNIKFCKNPSGGSQVVPCRRTDSLTDGNRRTWQCYLLHLPILQMHLKMGQF